MGDVYLCFEQALSLLVSENGGGGGGGGPEEKADGPSGASLNDNDNDDGAEDGGACHGVTLPRSGLRLAVVFDASSSSPERSGGGGGGGGVPAAGGGRWWLPAVFEAVGSRSPDKVRRDDALPCRGRQMQWRIILRRNSVLHLVVWCDGVTIIVGLWCP